MSAHSPRLMQAMRTALLAAPAVLAVFAVVVGVALQHQPAQPLSPAIANRHVVLADDADDLAQEEEEEQQQEQDELQEQLDLQEMLQSEQEAEEQNELAEQEAQQAEQQGQMVEQQAGQ